MDRPDARPITPRATIGLLACALVLLVPLAWVAGWAWLAVPAALAALGVTAVAVGADSRAPGDWVRAGPT
jgi:hypothetical protein